MKMREHAKRQQKHKGGTKQQPSSFTPGKKKITKCRIFILMDLGQSAFIIFTTFVISDTSSLCVHPPALHGHHSLRSRNKVPAS
ncbi:hypothetical protein C1H46_044269 [Malus baccata]|uniref:Uncharacterized protein n=1 Tax=Malus baccata TaxID=106549 RepID=A0A540K7J1_MALBA|nr:hypothetical protein C1H46_044269 [Malus baccata]